LSVLLKNVEPKDKGKYSKRQMLAQFADIGMTFVSEAGCRGKSRVFFGISYGRNWKIRVLQ